MNEMFFFQVTALNFLSFRFNMCKTLHLSFRSAKDLMVVMVEKGHSDPKWSNVVIVEKGHSDPQRI